METLESLRRRITSVQDVQSVVTTMKTLAAVNIRQYEAAVEALSDYDHALQLAFQVLLRGRELPTRVSTATESNAAGAVVFGSDQGMCGMFNDEIASFALRHLKRESGDMTWSLLTVGARAQERLRAGGYLVEHNYSLPVSGADITRLVQELLPHVQRWQAERKISRLFVFYNTRTSASSYHPGQIQLLPISRQQMEAWKHQPWQSRSLPLYTMAWRELFSAAVRQYLFLSLFRACAESLASENASRIASMQAAEKNIDERLMTLQTRFHQLRQTSITEELLDVVTGFEALAKTRRRR